MKAELVDLMGDDLAVVNAARVSFDKESEWDLIQSYDSFGELSDTIKLGEKDDRLIRYLAKHKHWTPFSHCVIKMRETVPIFVARQRFKHMVGFTYNEVSRRYVSDAPEFYIPDVWRGAPTDGAKQGSSDLSITDFANVNRKGSVNEHYFNYITNSVDLYFNMLGSGIAPEQARMVLPQSMYTSYIVTGSLYAWARAYNLRNDSHAQQEIQDLARQWSAIIRPLFPVSWAALCGDEAGDSGLR